MVTFQNSNSFIVSRSVTECFAFFSNISNIGGCIPGCEDVSIQSETLANIRVRVKIGVLSKSLKFKVWIKEAKPPTNIRFEGSSDDATLLGDISLEPYEENSTRLIYNLSLRSLSTLASTAFSMMGKGLADQQAKEFIECVQRKIESLP